MAEQKSRRARVPVEVLNFSSDPTYSHHPKSGPGSSGYDHTDKGRVFGWGWSNASDENVVLSSIPNDHNPPQSQPYPRRDREQPLQIQYQSLAAAQCSFRTSERPSYPFQNATLPWGYTVPSSGNEDDTPSPEPMSHSVPFGYHQHHHHHPQPPQQPTSATNYFCLVEGCNMTTAQEASMQSHYNSVHFQALVQRIDCPWNGCYRIGDHGFARHDKMIEHMREVHRYELVMHPMAPPPPRTYSTY